MNGKAVKARGEAMHSSERKDRGMAVKGRGTAAKGRADPMAVEDRCKGKAVTTKGAPQGSPPRGAVSCSTAGTKAACQRRTALVSNASRGAAGPSNSLQLQHQPTAAAYSCSSGLPTGVAAVSHTGPPTAYSCSNSRQLQLTAAAGIPRRDCGYAPWPTCMSPVVMVMVLSSVVRMLYRTS